MVEVDADEEAASSVIISFLGGLVVTLWLPRFDLFSSCALTKGGLIPNKDEDSEDTFALQSCVSPFLLTSCSPCNRAAEEEDMSAAYNVEEEDVCSLAATPELANIGADGGIISLSVIPTGGGATAILALSIADNR